MLQLIASFIEGATPRFRIYSKYDSTIFIFRLKELTKLSPTSEHTKIPDVLDHKCHVKLSEVRISFFSKI